MFMNKVRTWPCNVRFYWRVVSLTGLGWDAQICLAAACCNQLSCLQYAHENGCSWTSEVCDAAAIRGAIQCLKYAHENGCQFSDATTISALYSHNFECLVYAVENGAHVPESILETAAFERDEQAIKYLLSKGFTWTSSRVKSKQVCHALTGACEIEGLKLAFKYGCPLLPWVTDIAAESGALEVAQFALDCGRKTDTCC